MTQYKNKDVHCDDPAHAATSVSSIKVTSGGQIAQATLNNKVLYG